MSEKLEAYEAALRFYASPKTYQYDDFFLPGSEGSTRTSPITLDAGTRAKKELEKWGEDV